MLKRNSALQVGKPPRQLRISDETGSPLPERPTDSFGRGIKPVLPATKRKAPVMPRATGPESGALADRACPVPDPLPGRPETEGVAP